jgi:NosR/NirI family nitrous oxide reductase transcriptional regulator
VESTILLVALALLTVLFFFQDAVVKDSRRTKRIRVAFLVFTLLFLGFYANAQLSVVNILTVFSALVSGFSWEYFLMEPLIFILWGGVFAGLLFWGRGAYCGWLCPYGAMQELLNGLAKWVKIPQLTVPWGLHERLWPVKYLLFLGLFGVSLHSLALAERLAEIEPFKTSIILKFVRDWPYVMYAVLLLIPCLFIERFYCRYLCPLGAALAIPARLHTFLWLKRYRQCGNPCQVCHNECMVQAIHPEGEINPNECLYCLHCQERYYDDEVCPVCVKKRERDERRSLIASDQTDVRGRAILKELRARKT